MNMKLAISAGIVVIFAALMVVGCSSSAASFDSRLGSIVKPYRFSIAGWELKAIPAEIQQWLFGKHEQPADDVRTVLNYFAHVEYSRALRSEIEGAGVNGRSVDYAAIEAEMAGINSQEEAMSDAVKKIISRQIKDTLAEQGIFNPADSLGLRFSFPPVNFKLGKPPNVLIVSHRDRIENIKEITLNQELSPIQVEDIESRVDALGVSSLVVEPGGFGGTYPTFVINSAGLRFTIDAATEEWLHQYLAFKPLGFRYVLHLTSISRDYEIVTINETVASMVSKEIGAMVYDRYYASQASGKEVKPPRRFDFNREMREIRREVDRLLAQGQVEQAEKFMEGKREYLAQNGYHIRKLNQAYFAFNGSYADSPTSISPIGAELRSLRSRSVSLRDFLDRAAGMTNRQDLINAVK